jgi:hypothetical protein
MLKSIEVVDPIKGNAVTGKTQVLTFKTRMWSLTWATPYCLLGKSRNTEEIVSRAFARGKKRVLAAFSNSTKL